MGTKVLPATHLNCDLSIENIQSYRDVILSLHQKLEDATELTGWLHYPEQNHEELLGQIDN